MHKLASIPEILQPKYHIFSSIVQFLNLESNTVLTGNGIACRLFTNVPVESIQYPHHKLPLKSLRHLESVETFLGATYLNGHSLQHLEKVGNLDPQHQHQVPSLNAVERLRFQRFERHNLCGVRLRFLGFPSVAER